MSFPSAHSTSLSSRIAWLIPPATPINPSRSNGRRAIPTAVRTQASATPASAAVHCGARPFADVAAPAGSTRWSQLGQRRTPSDLSTLLAGNLNRGNVRFHAQTTSVDLARQSSKGDVQMSRSASAQILPPKRFERALSTPPGGRPVMAELRSRELLRAARARRAKLGTKGHRRDLMARVIPGLGRSAMWDSSNPGWQSSGVVGRRVLRENTDLRTERRRGIGFALRRDSVHNRVFCPAGRCPASVVATTSSGRDSRRLDEVEYVVRVAKGRHDVVDRHRSTHADTRLGRVGGHCLDPGHVAQPCCDLAHAASAPHARDDEFEGAHGFSLSDPWCLLGDSIVRGQAVLPLSEQDPLQKIRCWRTSQGACQITTAGATTISRVRIRTCWLPVSTPSLNSA